MKAYETYSVSSIRKNVSDVYCVEKYLDYNSIMFHISLESFKYTNHYISPHLVNIFNALKHTSIWVRKVI